MWLTMSFNMVNQECIVFAWGACTSDKMHPNCDRLSPLPVISWPKMAVHGGILWLSVGEI